MNESGQGHLHPISSLIREINQIFFRMGFAFAEGPLLESEKYNFDLLNVPKDHPARDMQDTFFIENEPGFVLRTHTSPVQVRYMEGHKPPIRIICPGKAFRNEATDITHEAEFFQLEGLMVDEGVHLGHLKGVLEQFFNELFKGQVDVRFRPSFFPFVEPGVEVDMRISGEHVPAKLRDRWIEIMGAGEVHPDVIRNAGLDPKKFQGFAFGMGIDRLALLRYGIDDIRHFHSADLRFINQF